MTNKDIDAISVDVGNKLREMREARDLSIRALAGESGISANALSMIERGLSSPSVSTLYKVASALGVPITDLFRSQSDRKEIVFCKASSRTRVPFTRGVWEGLGGELFAGRVEPFALTLESGANSGPHPLIHNGHEFVICIRGQLEYRVENEPYLLEPGDSLLFCSQLRHRWRNPGPTVTNVVFVLSGFEEGEQPGEHHRLQAGLKSRDSGNVDGFH
jgi:DNA-binding XRE family transcriptional regulator/quercetin dioxygenase-like cupin family protein